MEEIAIGPQPGPQVQFLSRTRISRFTVVLRVVAKLMACCLKRHATLIILIMVPLYSVGKRCKLLVRVDYSIRHIHCIMKLMADLKCRRTVRWRFPSGSTITFSHLHNKDDVNDWQGSQIPLIGYDELTHFTEWQFWYMLSRNRSMCGVKPYVRATCNPDADSWVAELVAWYINPDTGYPIPDRSGKIRYFVRLDNALHWSSSRQELIDDFPGLIPKSFTFVPATLDDNIALNQQDPNYKANLLALNRVERERLLHGNWKVKPESGSYFPSVNVSIIPAVPTDVKSGCVVGIWQQLNQAKQILPRAQRHQCLWVSVLMVVLLLPMQSIFERMLV